MIYQKLLSYDAKTLHNNAQLHDFDDIYFL